MIVRTVDAACGIAESPLWLGPGRGLRWVDAARGDVHALVDGRHGSWPVAGATVSAVAAGTGGDLLLAAGRELWRVPDGPFPGTPTVVAHVPAATPGTRLNDAKVGPDGRLWAGTLNRERPAAEALWSIGRDGDVRRHWTGVTQSNGIAWSPGGETIYFVDSGAGTLSRGAFGDPLGEVEVILRLDRATEGVPDGLTVDATGDLWLAVWGGHGLLHLDAGGTRLATVDLPERYVTSCAFAGDRLDLLAVTTAADGEGPGGAVHLLDVGRTGLPGHVFG